MSKLLALSAFLFCSFSYASSLNLIASNDARINDTNVIYLNQYMLFFGEQLSVYDTTTGQFENIETPPVTSFYDIAEHKGY